MPKFDSITLDIGGGQGPKFTPVSNQNGLSTWYDYEDAATPALLPKLTVSVAQPSKTSKLFKTRVKLVVPQPKHDVSGAVLGVADHQNSVDITFLSADNAVPFERSSMLAMAIATLQNELIKDVVQNARSVY